MEVKKVIVRKPVAAKDEVKAMLIFSEVNVGRFTQLINKKNSTPEEALFVAETVCALNEAAKLLGFQDLNDMIEFTKIYGAEAIV